MFRSLVLFLLLEASKAQNWLLVEVNGSVVWSAPKGLGTSGWVSAQTDPFKLGSRASALSFATRSGGRVCFEDVKLLPLVAPPPAVPLVALWTGMLGVQGVPSFTQSQLNQLAARLGVFAGAPASIGTVIAAPFGLEVPFTVSATSQPQMEAVALNLYTNQPTSGSYMQSSGASTSVVSAALLGFLKNDFANLTTVEILSLVASVGVGPVQDFAKTPLPPYAPVAPAMPLAPPRPGSRIGCSAGPGLSAPFTGAIQDFQIYVPALSSACMGSLVLNSTASCPTAAPPAPTIAPPAPSQQIQPVGTLLSTLDQFVVPGALCGPARQGPIILANQQTCIIGSRAQISALPHGSLSGAGAPTGDRFITMQSGGAFSVSGATVGTGTFKLSWRHTTDQLSAPGAAGAPIITIRQSNGKVLHSSPVRNGLSFKPVNSTCTFDAPSQMIQFSMAGPSGWSVFIDNVVAFGSQPVAGCVVATPPAPPPAPPPSQPPPATMTDSIVVATGLSGVIPTNQARAVRVQGALGSPYLSILTLGGPSSVPSSRASTRVPGGFCGASQSGSTSILLSTPDQAQSILNDMSNGTLPFVPQIQFLSSLQTMALAAQQGGAQQSLGDVANVWSPDGAGGYVGTISNTNPALSGLNCRLCALFSGGPSGVLAMDSGTASMSLLSATVTSLTLGTPPAPPNPAAPNPAPPPPVPKPPQQPPPNPPTPTATPTGTVTFNSGGGSANDYTNNAFRCAQPSLKAVVNQTHVIMTLTSWAEAWGDVKTTDTADGFNAGRAVFTYATFNPTLAATTLWDPANPMPTRQAFGVADSTPALADRYRYNGSCSLSEAGGEPEFTTTANMTLQPQYSGWRPGMTTSNFRNITIQSAGCTCATYSVVGGGVAIPAVGCSGVDSPSNHVFWSDGTQGPWSVRQTTCGADGSPQQCSPATLYSYFPTDNSLVACSLRTESLLVLTLPAFKATLASVLPSAGSSALTLSTEIEIVEVGSTAAVNATHGVDSLQTRYTHSDLVITLLPAAAIVEVIEPGGTANPLLITVQGTLGTYGGPAMVRCLSDSRTVQLVWQTNGYVMQSNAYMTGSPAPIVPDTTFQVSTMMLSKYRVLWNVTGNYSTSCALWVGMPDGQQLPAGNTSTLSCALPGCKPIPTSSLPAFFSATNAVSMAVQSGTFYWTQYYMKVTCNLTAPEPVPDTADYIIPSGIMTVPYALQDVSGTLITDSFVPPFVQFNTNPYILPALVAENVSFELSVRTVAIAERSISNATTLSDYFVDVDSMSSPASIEFSQAFAFSVQLVSQATRALWTLRPSFVLMTVFDGPQSGSAGVQNALNPGQMLDESFCGMNRTDQIAAWGLVDVQRAPNVSSAPDALLNAQSWLSSASDALSPGLVTAIEGVLSGSSFSDFTSLQGDILPPKAPSSSAGLAAAVPDGTGGFAVPLRNRLFVDASSAAGYTMMFCSVVTATPYTQLVAFGSFPVYTNKQAAMADSLSVNGAFAPAFGVPGYVLDPKNGDALMYWFPSMPASTSSLICASIDVVGPYVPALVQNVVTIQSPSSPACQSFVKSISGRRRLLTTQKKLEFSALKTPKVKRKVATQYAQLLLGKNSPPTPPLPPLPPPHPPPTASNYTTRLFDKTAIGSAGLSATTLAVIVVTSVVGGVGAILGIVGCFWWCYRKKPHTGAPRFNSKYLRV